MSSRSANKLLKNKLMDYQLGRAARLRADKVQPVGKAPKRKTFTKNPNNTEPRTSYFNKAIQNIAQHLGPGKKIHEKIGKKLQTMRTRGRATLIGQDVDHTMRWAETLDRYSRILIEIESELLHFKGLRRLYMVLHQCGASSARIKAAREIYRSHSSFTLTDKAIRDWYLSNYPNAASLRAACEEDRKKKTSLVRKGIPPSLYEKPYNYFLAARRADVELAFYKAVVEIEKLDGTYRRNAHKRELTQERNARKALRKEVGSNLLGVDLAMKRIQQKRTGAVRFFFA
ncbi:hypothetical protein F4777DRAFT_552822 [Nemania sp. FL0916]|nr:hypothetical protein F4777DRAFT_552822 [Nemania sp. FL0916]